MAGVVVAGGGLALMGFGTIGSPLSAGALAGPPSSEQSITGITVSCSNLLTTGTLTVSGAVSGDKVTLEVFAHKPGIGTWFATGATETITMVAGTSNYSYSISGVPASFADGTVTGDDGSDSLDPDAAGDDYNAWRVQVSGVVGTFDGTTTKSDSYECPGTTTTSTSSTTSTTSSTPATTTTSTTTSTTSSTPATTTTSTTTSTTSSTPATSTTSTTTSTPATSTTSSESSSSSTSSTSSATAPESSTSTTSSKSSTTSSSAASSTAPASTSTASTPGTGVGAATITPSTGVADGEFGIGLGLLIAGGGLVAAAARVGRRTKK